MLHNNNGNNMHGAVESRESPVLGRNVRSWGRNSPSTTSKPLPRIPSVSSHAGSIDTDILITDLERCVSDNNSRKWLTSNNY